MYMYQKLYLNNNGYEYFCNVFIFVLVYFLPEAFKYKNILKI